MKRTLLLLVLGAIPVLAQTPAEDQVRQAEKAWAGAVMKNDSAALERILGERLIYAHSTGVVESKADYLGKLKAGTQKYDAIEQSDMTVRVYGNSAVAHSKVHMAGNTKGTPFDNRLMMLHLWVKQGGRWQVAAHQTPRLPWPPEPAARHSGRADGRRRPTGAGGTRGTRCNRRRRIRPHTAPVWAWTLSSAYLVTPGDGRASLELWVAPGILSC